jgi:hypothetical protein
MNTHFTLRKRRRSLSASLLLLVLSTGCTNKTERPADNVKLSADLTENKYLTQILSGRNKDSIINYAHADYNENKYYIFRTTMPGEEKFDIYFAIYAKQKYNLTLVNCGSKSRTGACYYNAEMSEFLAKAKIKPLAPVYLEAKSLYYKELSIRYAAY